MTDVTVDVAGDSALKAKHRAMWAQGDYGTVAATLIADLGRTLVEACGVQPGQRVLDVAAGTGNVAIPAAQAGAKVVASDLTPELFVRGKQLAEQAGVSLTWEEADAEALPYADASYDTVLSCVGVMFAPHHQASADELLRVVRPGGTIGLASWTPEGFIGQMFAVMRPFAPPPPPGAQPPPLWGDEAHVRTLFGDSVSSLEATRTNVRVSAFATPEEFREFFKTHYGPTISVYKAIADDPAKISALDEGLAELGRRFRGADGEMDWEYLLVKAVRR